MKTRRFDFNFSPLQINVSMVTVGGVPDNQSYDADTKTYTPDYTIDASNLIIQPIVGRIDKDEILPSGKINQDLTNIVWYIVNSGASDTAITTSNTSFEVTTSGVNAGRLRVKKNAQPRNPINLRFEAEYRDPRMNQVYHIIQTYQVQCRNSTMCTPVLLLDAAEQTLYNPLVDVDKQVVHALLRLGTNECPEEKRLFVWEVMREDGTFSEVGADTTLDYDVEVSEDGASCTVDRSLMGTELCLRCRAKYSIDGTPESVELTDNAPSKTVVIVRRIPEFEFDITGVPTNVANGILEIAPEAYIQDNNGAIEDPERELLPLWYAAANKASGSLDYSLVAHGITPVLSTSNISNTLGGVYGLDVKDVGPTCAWEDSDGALFEDGDGNVILIK